MYNYYEAIKDDILEYIRDNYTGEEIRELLTGRDDWEQSLYDDLWITDSVTGNASGSYTFNTWKAREYVIDNMELLKEACQEFCCMDALGEKIVNEEWEYCDVTIRCYLLGWGISKALDDLEEETEE